MAPRPDDLDPLDARILFEALAEQGEKHTFRLRDGRAFEGWVLEVGDEAVLVADAGPSDETYSLAFEKVDLASLAYINEEGHAIALSPADPTVN